MKFYWKIRFNLVRALQKLTEMNSLYLSLVSVSGLFAILDSCA